MFDEPKYLEEKMIPIKWIYFKHKPTVSSKEGSHFKIECIKGSLFKPNEKWYNGKVSD